MPANIYLKKDDTEFFPTPEKIKQELYVMLEKHKKCKTILDPCCGDGGLENFDGRYDYTLFDLVDRSEGKFEVIIGDFLKQNPTAKYDAVIMNPPFGMCSEFIKHAFSFSDDLFVICPFRSVLRNFDTSIVDLKTHYTWPMMFGVRVGIGIVYLKKQKFGIGRPFSSKLFNEKLPKEKTFAHTFYRADKAPDKWYIVNRLTMTRCLRDHRLIQDYDIYGPGDESGFVAISGNINVKIGQHLDRDIMEFDTYEDCKKFQKLYDDNAEYVRNYVYMHGSSIVRLNTIPLLK